GGRDLTQLRRHGADRRGGRGGLLPQRRDPPDGAAPDARSAATLGGFRSVSELFAPNVARPFSPGRRAHPPGILPVSTSVRSTGGGRSSWAKVQEAGSRSGRHRRKWVTWRNRWP